MQKNAYHTGAKASFGCTCGHLLKANRGAIQCTLDLLSQLPEYVIKKGRPHGHSFGKTPENKENHQAHNLKKRFIKKHVKGIHDRFLKDPEFRASQLEHDRDEEVCIKMDDHDGIVDLSQ